MEISIKSQKEEPLLFRTVVEGEGTNDGPTISKAEAQKLVAGELKCDENLIVIDNIRTYFGLRKIMVTAYKYNDVESLKKVEPVKKNKAEKAGKSKKPEDKAKN